MEWGKPLYSALPVPGVGQAMPGVRLRTTILKKEEYPNMGHKGAQHPAGKPKPGQAKPAAPKKK